jgi:uncharacterized protein YndB with AHSA1/START domain
MSDYGVVTKPDSVRFERVLPGPIERVWAFITESDKRATWLASGPMDLRVGGAVHLTWHHSELSAEKQAPQAYKQYDGYQMHGRVTRCEPPRLLSYTWPDETGHESEVCFELTARGNEVLLVLTHRRIGNHKMLLSVSGGWHTHIGILMDQLNGVEPRPFWTTHERLQAEYNTRIGAE